jgi:heme-degrading monooxygenase HmoA
LADSDHVFRVDKFIVPMASRATFIAKLRETHELLRRQSGFIRDFILEQASGPGKYNVVTMVEWADQAAIDAAKEAVIEMQSRTRFNPRELFTKLNVVADLATYRPTPEEQPAQQPGLARSIDRGLRPG